MYKTYYVEGWNGDILGYYGKLSEAKKEGKRYHQDYHKIVKLVGPYRYEGRHARVLKFENGKYTIQK